LNHLVLDLYFVHGLFTAQVTATDWDDGDNGRVTYIIPETLASQFNVDQRGVISAHIPVDREKYNTFRFPIMAVDAGSPARTGSAFVIINVDDVNDEPPSFTKRSFIFSIAENEPAGTQVGYQ